MASNRVQNFHSTCNHLAKGIAHLLTVKGRLTFRFSKAGFSSERLEYLLCMKLVINDLRHSMTIPDNDE